MSDLSNAVENNTGDPHWDINEQVKGANYVEARPSHDNKHLNLYIDYEQVEIPNIKVDISDTRYGVVASAR